MNKLAMMAAVAAAALMAAPMAAHADWYAGAAYTNFDYDGGGDVDAITGRLGYRMSPNFAVEGEASTGIEDDAVELDYNAGLYAVGIVPVTSNFDLHGRIGYQGSEVETPLGDISDDGLGYGVGATWRFTPGFGVRADWTRLDGDEGEADALSIGGVVNF